jgi:hypothetical protein
MVWGALEMKNHALDVSRVVVSAHQSQDYQHELQDNHRVSEKEEDGVNYKFASGWKPLRTSADMPDVPCANGLKSKTARPGTAVRRCKRVGRVTPCEVWQPAWFFLLGIARPFRPSLGLGAEVQRRSRGKT